MHVGVIRVRRWSLHPLPLGAVATLIGKTRSCDSALACVRDALRLGSSRVGALQAVSKTCGGGCKGGCRFTVDVGNGEGHYLGEVWRCGCLRTGSCRATAASCKKTRLLYTVFLLEVYIVECCTCTSVFVPNYLSYKCD
jgi:hypothetical protein